jgi:two-component system, chemotaxis family, chemotaxis protein CheY
MAINNSLPILVVDDYRTMIRIIRNLLTMLGFENVEDAQDGRAALAKLRERRFGLVISDWNMEPMSGIDLLHEVRTDPDLGALPFIMVTADGRDESIARARAAGASAYVVKPFNAETLAQRIVSALAA